MLEEEEEENEKWIEQGREVSKFKSFRSWKLDQEDLRVEGGELWELRLRYLVRAAILSDFQRESPLRTSANGRCDGLDCPRQKQPTRPPAYFSERSPSWL